MRFRGSQPVLRTKDTIGDASPGHRSLGRTPVRLSPLTPGTLGCSCRRSRLRVCFGLHAWGDRPLGYQGFRMTRERSAKGNGAWSDREDSFLSKGLVFEERSAISLRRVREMGNTRGPVKACKGMAMMTIEECREFCARELLFAANLTTPGLVEAFAKVPREHFLGSGPWQLGSAEGRADRARRDVQNRAHRRRLCNGVGEPAGHLFGSECPRRLPRTAHTAGAEVGRLAPAEVSETGFA